MAHNPTIRNLAFQGNLDTPQGAEAIRQLTERSKSVLDDLNALIFEGALDNKQATVEYLIHDLYNGLSLIKQTYPGLYAKYTRSLQAWGK